MKKKKKKKGMKLSPEIILSLNSQAVALFETLVKVQQNSPNILPLYLPQRKHL